MAEYCNVVLGFVTTTITVPAIIFRTIADGQFKLVSFSTVQDSNASIISLSDGCLFLLLETELSLCNGKRLPSLVICHIMI